MKIIKVKAKLLFILLAINVFSSVAMASVSVSLSFNAPPAREMVVAPGGYNNCYDVAAGFDHGVWVNAHSVCEYGAAYPENVWIAGYWGCMSYRPGVCSRWAWYPSHWVRRGGAEYGIAWHEHWHNYHGFHPGPHHHYPDHHLYHDHYHHDHHYDHHDHYHH